MFFQQSYALSFNGINDYVSLPVGLLNRYFTEQSTKHNLSDPELTIDMMILAHAVPARPPPEAGTKPHKAVTPPAGGVLFSCQDREFGRSRRAARLQSTALLYIGTDGYLYSGLAQGPMKSSRCLADEQWHRITLTMRLIADHHLFACLFIDGDMDCSMGDMYFTALPSYPVLGSGVTEGCPAGASTPVYNCHSFHGVIDELRIWARALPAYQVCCAVRMCCPLHAQLLNYCNANTDCIAATVLKTQDVFC